MTRFTYRSMHDLIKRKDPGFHSGLMSGHSLLADMLSRAERWHGTSSMASFVEYQDLRNYRDGKGLEEEEERTADLGRADELVQGTLDLKVSGEKSCILAVKMHVLTRRWRCRPNS